MNYIEWLGYFASLESEKGYFTTGEAVKYCTLSRQTVSNYIRKMTKAGYLTKISRGRYMINFANSSVSAIGGAIVNRMWREQ